MICNGKNVLIITGGCVEEEFLKIRVEKMQYDMIIAADRGLLFADKLNLPLDFIVGDFDSVPQTVLKRYHSMSTQIHTFPPEKDKTDTQIALELALMHGATSIDFIGATGTRMDHVLGNLHLLLLPLQCNVDAHIIDRNNKMYLKKKSFTIQKEKQHGTYVSLLPFLDNVTGIVLKGFKYPLNNVTLSAGNSLGISNELLAEIGVIDFKDGILIVMETMD